MRIEYAAHRDHPISHSSTTATIGLSLAAAAVAAVLVIGSGGTALVVLSVVGTAGSVFLNVGKIVDSFLPQDTRGAVTSGAPNVFLGPDIKPAARADADDTKVDCCGDFQLAEGSRIVVIGPDIKPMGRRGDRTKCGGILADGIRSVMVGGDPSREGASINEQDSRAVTALSAVWDVIGGGTTMAKRGALNLARGATQLTAVGLGTGAGYDDAGKVLKAIGTGRPGGLLELADAGFTARDTAVAGVNIATSIVSPTPAR